MNTTKPDSIKVIAPDIQSKTLLLHLDTYEGRFAARAFAYCVMSDKPELARQILEKVGREG